MKKFFGNGVVWIFSARQRRKIPGIVLIIKVKIKKGRKFGYNVAKKDGSARIFNVKIRKMFHEKQYRQYSYCLLNYL